jgi:AcrR family transcriptional regulator
MTIASRRGRPRTNAIDQLKLDFLRHALDHFLEAGFEATRVSDVTRSFGMSKQTVYAHFGDKLGLFKAALQNAIDEWLVPLEGLHLQECDDLHATLVGVGGEIARTLMSPAGLRLIRISNTESFRLPEMAEFTDQRGHRKIADYLCDLFTRRLPEAVVQAGSAQTLVTAFLDLISGPARRSAWRWEREQVDIEQFIRHRVGIFLNGVQAAATAR